MIYNDFELNKISIWERFLLLFKKPIYGHDEYNGMVLKMKKMLGGTIYIIKYVKLKRRKQDDMSAKV